MKKYILFTILLAIIVTIISNIYMIFLTLIYVYISDKSRIFALSNQEDKIDNN